MNNSPNKNYKNGLSSRGLSDDFHENINSSEK